jgi:SAM-dependent methyltransferase
MTISNQPIHEKISSQTIAGYVDVISRNAISGWAEDRDSDHPVLISLLINGKEIATSFCGNIRQDVVEAGFKNGRSFHFNPIRSLKDGVNEVEVKFAKTQETLPQGQGRLEYDKAQHVAEHWSSIYEDKHHFITRWWQYDRIVRHVNEKVCGEAIPGLSHGLYRKIQNRFANRTPFERAVSVGCGEAIKEIAFVGMGLAASFDLYELSQYAIDQGTQLIKNAGLSGCMKYHLRDPFQIPELEASYDVVFWNNSLHHMFDVDSAIRWSKKALKKSGIFVMDEFVGPSYMQWSDRLLEINTKVREQLPTAYLRDPRNPDCTLAVKMERPNVDEFCAIDPSECVDSGRILQSLHQHFPNLEIIPTGGGVYHLALNDVLHNIVQAQDQDLLNHLLAIDDECIALGETHYAVAIGVRE